MFDIGKNEVTTFFDAKGNIPTRLYDRKSNRLNGSDLVVMSFNIQRCKGLNSDENLISAIFKKYNPDIAAFQEYDTVVSPSELPMDEYLKSFWGYLQVGEATSANFSKAVASHIPLSDVVSVDYTNLHPNQERRSYHKSYIEFNGKNIAVFNTHLATSTSKNSEGVQYKVLQAQELCEVVKQEEYFILMGDFNTNCTNADHVDYTNQVKPFVDEGFNLANCCDEFGFNDTYTDGTSLDDTWLPCDHVITSANISINRVIVDSMKVDANTGLTIDHLPLVAYLTVN